MNNIYYAEEGDKLIIGGKGWLFQNGSLGELAPDARVVEIRRRIKPGFLSFSGMTKLKHISGLRNVDTSEITSMADMFRGCPLTEIDLSCFNTGNVTDMSGMFYGTAIRKLDLSSFDARKVKNFTEMFAECPNLREIHFKGFRKASPEECEGMFNGDFLKDVYMSFDESHLPEYCDWDTDECHYIRKYMRDHEEIFHNGIHGELKEKEDNEGMVWVQPHYRNGYPVSGFWRKK